MQEGDKRASVHSSGKRKQSLYFNREIVIVPLHASILGTVGISYGGFGCPTREGGTTVTCFTCSMMLVVVAA